MEIPVLNANRVDPDQTSRSVAFHKFSRRQIGNRLFALNTGISIKHGYNNN